MTVDEYGSLLAILREWDGRRRLQELLRYLPLGLAIGLCFGLAAALLSRARPLLTREELALLALAAALIAAAMTGFVLMARRRSPGEQARFADRQFRLRERMTTAVEIQAGELPVDELMAARQLGDALRAASQVDAKRQLPLRSRATDWLPPLLAGALLALALWLPNPQEAVLIEQRAAAAVVEAQSQALAELLEEIQAGDTLTPEQQDALTRPLEEALAVLQEPNLSREEAVAALSAAEAELRSLSEELDPTSLNEALAEAASELDAQSELAEALRSGQLGQSAAAVDALAESLGQTDAEARAALAEQLSAAANALEAADPELAGALEQAAEALAEGDVETAQSALEAAAGQLAERDQATAAAAEASSAADHLGQARGEVAQGGEGEQAGGEGEGAAQGGEGQSGTGESGSPLTGGQQGGAGGPSEGGGHVESVFVPQRPEIDVEGEDVELEVQCLSDPEACGPLAGQSPSDPGGQSGGSFVPYSQVFGDYRDAAFEALSEGNIPVGLQDLIRDYFSALEP